MNVAKLAPSLVGFIAGITALCLHSEPALAAPPALPVFTAKISLERAQSWGYSLPRTPYADAIAARFFASTGPRAETFAASAWKSQGARGARSQKSGASAKGRAASFRLPPTASALVVEGLGGERFDPYSPLYTMSPETFVMAAPLLWASQRMSQREPTFGVRYGCGSSSGCGGRQAGRGAATEILTGNPTADLGIGMLAGWLVPQALTHTVGSKPSGLWDTGKKDDEKRGLLSMFTIPDFLVYPSVTFTEEGNLDGVGAGARGIF